VSNEIDDFWVFIDVQRASIPEPVDSHESLLRSAHDGLDGGIAIQYSKYYSDLFESLNKIEIWEACSLIAGAPCGDDSFSYFRNWVIWQGEEVTSAMLLEPETLLDLARAKKISLSDPFVESLSMLSVHGARDANIPLSQTDFMGEWNWQESSAEKISQRLPRLWAVYGGSFFWAPQQQPPASHEVSVDGLGILNVGDSVNHKSYGAGTIVTFPIPGSPVALIRFADAERGMHIDAKLFSRISL
jgi:hypothetical protein